jgi:nucleotide-binding universal stress UspA family protein
MARESVVMPIPIAPGACNSRSNGARGGIAGNTSAQQTASFGCVATGSIEAEMADPPETLTIVVGYDGSDAARRGLARVGQLVGGHLSVVIVAVAPDVRSPGLGAELSGRSVDTRLLLEEARVLLGARDGLAIETRAAVGDPAAVLVDVAREMGAELVIVGRRGGDFVSRTLLGSVAQRVAQSSPCDVLVVA